VIITRRPLEKESKVFPVAVKIFIEKRSDHASVV
jgi:hypothetical protein